LLIRGFLKVYCQALGVDPQPILEEYGAEIRRYDDEGERLKRYRSWMRKTPRKGGAFLVLFVVLALGVTLGGVWAVWWPKYQLKKTATLDASREAVYPQQELPGDLVVKKGLEDGSGGSIGEQAAKPGVLPEGEAVTPVPDSSASGSVNIVAEESAEKAPNDMEATEGVRASAGSTAGDSLSRGRESGTMPAASHILHIAADQETWIQVQLDDGKPQNRILKPGDTAQWTLSRSVLLWTGNAGGIRVSWDGKPLKPLGKRGEVLKVKLPDPRFLESP